MTATISDTSTTATTTTPIISKTSNKIKQPKTGWLWRLRMFQIEIFAFIFTFAASVEDVTVQLVAQDKICMKRLNSTRICSNLSTIDEKWHSHVLLMIKDEVLVKVTMFNFYQTLINTIPLIFTSLFLSSWADRHRKSAKILLCLTSLMFLMESVLVFINVINFHWDVYLMLIPFAFFPMVGGAQVVSMTIISYLTITTTPEKRIKRFAILELIIIVSNPLGVFIGGQLIRSDAKLSQWAQKNGQLHNYHYVIMVGLAVKTLAFLYALLCKFQKPAKKPKKHSISNEETDPLLMKIKLLKKERKRKYKKTRRYRVFKYARSVSDIFVMRNISESFEVCYRRRQQHLHIFIWLMLIAMTLFTMTQMSLRTLLFQFVQKVYYWDAATYSTYNAILYITTHMFGLLVFTPLLTEVFHLSDSTLLMVGLLSVMAQNFIRGTIIDVAAFCSSYFFGSVTSLVSVSIRTKLSKLIAPDEQYRLFGMLTMMETISPMIGISIFTQIFNKTIGTYPGFVYQFSCFILLAPIIIASYININLPIALSSAAATTTTTTSSSPKTRKLSKNEPQSSIDDADNDDVNNENLKDNKNIVVKLIGDDNNNDDDDDDDNDVDIYDVILDEEDVNLEEVDEDYDYDYEGDDNNDGDDLDDNDNTQSKQQQQSNYFNYQSLHQIDDNFNNNNNNNNEGDNITIDPDKSMTNTINKTNQK